MNGYVPEQKGMDEAFLAGHRVFGGTQDEAPVPLRLLLPSSSSHRKAHGLELCGSCSKETGHLGEI